MSDTVKIKVGFECLSVAGADHEDIVEIDRAEWDAMTADEREAMLEGMADVELSNSASAYAYVIDEEEAGQ